MELMSKLIDEIESLRLGLREKHTKELLQINALAAEQSAYQNEITRALENLIAAQEQQKTKIEKLVGTVAAKFGFLPRMSANQTADMIESTPAVSAAGNAQLDYQFELEHALKQPTRIAAFSRN